MYTSLTVLSRTLTQKKHPVGWKAKTCLKEKDMQVISNMLWSHTRYYSLPTRMTYDVFQNQAKNRLAFRIFNLPRKGYYYQAVNLCVCNLQNCIKELGLKDSSWFCPAFAQTKANFAHMFVHKGRCHQGLLINSSLNVVLLAA